LKAENDLHTNTAHSAPERKLLPVCFTTRWTKSDITNLFQQQMATASNLIEFGIQRRCWQMHFSIVSRSSHPTILPWTLSGFELGGGLLSCNVVEFWGRETVEDEDFLFEDTPLRSLQK